MTSHDQNWEYRRYREQFEYTLGIPFVEGNRVQFLKNGVEIFPAMLRAIESAQKSVDLLTYAYWSGDIAAQFADVLSAKAAAGVRVRVLLDAYGAARMPDKLIQQLEDSNAKLRWFRPLATWRIWRNDNRTHRKLLVVDDVLGFTGGVGIADEWNGDARNENEWRETHSRLEGPVAHQLKAAFLDNWNEADEWTFDVTPDRPEHFADGYPVQVVSASSTIGWTKIASVLRLLVATSEKSLIMTTPYFVPDDKLVKLLCDAAHRGVAVQIIISGKYCDMRVSQLAGQVSIEELLAAGVQIWRYQRTNLHAKLAVVDGLVCCIGSANLNHRSMGKDEECCAIILSRELAQTLCDQFDNDIEHSEQFQIDQWRKRGLRERLLESMSRFLVEQL